MGDGVYMAYNMPRYLRGRRKYDEAPVGPDGDCARAAAQIEISESHYKTLDEAKAARARGEPV